MMHPVRVDDNGSDEFKDFVRGVEDASGELAENKRLNGVPVVRLGW